MRIRIGDQDYRLYFRYRYERPVWQGAAAGRRHDLRSASWEEVFPDQIRDKKELKMSLASSGTAPNFLRTDLYRTVEAVLEQLLPEVNEGRPDGVVIASGISRCSPLDRYEKSKGMVQAFDKLKAALAAQVVDGKKVPGIFTGQQIKQLFEAFRDRGISELALVDRTIERLQRYRAKLIDVEAAKNEAVAIGKRKELGI